MLNVIQFSLFLTIEYFGHLGIQMWQWTVLVLFLFNRNGNILNNYQTSLSLINNYGTSLSLIKKTVTKRKASEC